MTGTSSPSAMSSMPRLKGKVVPVRLIEPSAKMQTTWPSSSSARARLMALTASLPALTGMTFMRRRNQPKPPLKNPDQAMKRTKRCTQAPTSSPSTKDM
jgi:hypothetical protein